MKATLDLRSFPYVRFIVSKFLTILCFVVLYNRIYATSSILNEAKQSYDDDVSQYVNTMIKLNENIHNKNEELRDIATKMVYSIAFLHRIPLKYRYFTNGEATSFKKLIHSLGLNTCINYSNMEEEIKTMRNNLRMAAGQRWEQLAFRYTRKIIKNHRFIRNIKQMKRLGNKCVTDYQMDYVEALHCLDMVQEKRNSKIEADIHKSRMRYNALVEYVETLQKFERNYIETSLVAYNELFKQIDACLRFMGYDLTI